MAPRVPQLGKTVAQDDRPPVRRPTFGHMQLDAVGRHAPMRHVARPHKNRLQLGLMRAAGERRPAPPTRLCTDLCRGSRFTQHHPRHICSSGAGRWRRGSHSRRTLRRTLEKEDVLYIGGEWVTPALGPEGLEAYLEVQTIVLS